MLVVIPFCDKDWVSCVKNLEWAKELDNHLDFHAILAYEERTDPSHVGEATRAAEAVFSKVSIFYYPNSTKTSWPAGPNWAWQSSARYVAQYFPYESWLWWEADAIPIRKGWLVDIAAEHIRGGKAFSGHVVDGLGHLTGVAVYPGVVAAYSADALRTEEAAWDVVLGTDIREHIHAAHTLFQHSWCINPDTGKAWNGSGEIPTFKSPHDVVRLVDTTMALFHRNKDGTLIEQLRRFYAHPEEAFVPSHTQANGVLHPSQEVAPGGAAVVLPDNTSIETKDEAPEGSPAVPQGNEPFTGQCEILIVTYHKDAQWLQLALATIKRHATGFAGITLCLPKRDREAFAWLNSFNTGHRVNVKLYDEAPGKGMIGHMAVMASADQFVPDGTTHVLHMDADCMVKEAITPSEYFHGVKPVYVIRSYTGLFDPVRKVVSDCAQWKEPTEKQLGFETDVYTMCRHPTGFPIGFYVPYRQHVERVQKRDFFAYMLSGKNSHPQNRMDFTAMGAFAHKYMHDKFVWVDVDKAAAPKDKVKPYHSHSGVSPEIQKEIEGFLA